MPAHFTLWAVHLQDNVLATPWWLGGLLAAAVLAFFGAWRIREEEVPRVALLAAAFFVTSLIHVPVPGGPRTHLLLNGLLGVVLGRRALLAIPVGLFLQAALFNHGGYTTLGLNTCVMALPALAAGALFDGLRRLAWVGRPWFRAGLVAASTLLFTLSAVYAVSLLLTSRLVPVEYVDTAGAARVTFHPATLLAALALAAAAAWAERRMDNAPEFALGLLLGEVAVLLTIALNALVLVWGGLEDWRALALITFVVHLPLAVLEGVVLGFAVGFLARVKPELLGWKPVPRKVGGGEVVGVATGGVEVAALAVEEEVILPAGRLRREAPPTDRARD